jgi:hypothetical protein
MGSPDFNLPAFVFVPAFLHAAGYTDKQYAYDERIDFHNVVLIMLINEKAGVSATDTPAVNDLIRGSGLSHAE